MATKPPTKTAAKPRRTIIAEAAKPSNAQGMVTNPEAVAAQAEALANEERVIVHSPKAFTLTLDGHVDLHVRPGVQEMAKSVAEHWFVKAQGVKVYDPTHAPQ